MRTGFTMAIITVLGIGIILQHVVMKDIPTWEEIQEMVNTMNERQQWHNKFPQDFKLTFLNGETFQLSEHIGNKIIILNFFATWCGPCVKETPEFVRFYEENKEKAPLIILGINANEKEKLVKKFVSRYKISYPVGIDKDRSIEEKFSVDGYPTTVIIGVMGRIQLYEVGSIANADISFNPFIQTNIRLLEKGIRISKEDYFERLEYQNKKSKKVKTNKPRSINNSKKFVNKMKCPSCNKKLADCNNPTALRIKEKISKMDLEHKSDEEILKELFFLKNENNTSK